jgi:hypothetical protein
MSTKVSVSQPDGFTTGEVVEVFYTGLTQNATKGSRTAIATDLVVGSVLMETNEGFDRGAGNDYTRPFSAGITAKRPIIVVTEVPPGSKRGGVVRGVKNGVCRVLTTDASVLVNDGILPIDGSFTVADIAAGNRDYSSYGSAMTASADTNLKFITVNLDQQSVA